LHKYSAKYVCSGDTTDGGNIFIWEPIPAGDEDQYKFELIPTADDYCYLKHKYSGKFVTSGDMLNGGNIFINGGHIPMSIQDYFKFKLISSP